MTDKKHDAPKRFENGVVEWYCQNCGEWVRGKLAWVAGQTALVCIHCDTTLERDYYGFADVEKVEPDYDDD